MTRRDRLAQAAKRQQEQTVMKEKEREIEDLGVSRTGTPGTSLGNGMPTKQPGQSGEVQSR